MDLSDIPGALMVAAASAIGATALASLKKPAQQQDQLMMLAMGGLAAFMLRQFETKGAATEGHSTRLATLESEQKTLFRRTDELATDRDELSNSVHTLTLEMHRLVGRLDQYFADYDSPPPRVRQPQQTRAGARPAAKKRARR